MSRGYNAEVYDKQYSSAKYKLEDRFLYSIIGNLIKKAGSRPQILDIGCGTGNVLDNIFIPKGDYKGIDIDAQFIRIAQTKHKGYSFVEADVNKYLFRDHDLLLCVYSAISYADMDDIIKRTRGKDFIYHIHSPRHITEKDYYGDLVIAPTLQTIMQKFKDNGIYGAKAIGFNVFGNRFHLITNGCFIRLDKFIGTVCPNLGKYFIISNLL